MSHMDESLSTLRFASRAKNITNMPVINEIVSDGTLLRRYKDEILELRKQLDANRVADEIRSAVEQERRESMTSVSDTHNKTVVDEDQRVLKSKLEVMSHKIIDSTSVYGLTPVKFSRNAKRRRQTWFPGVSASVDLQEEEQCSLIEIPSFSRRQSDIGVEPAMNAEKKFDSIYETISQICSGGEINTELDPNLADLVKYVFSLRDEAKINRIKIEELKSREDISNQSAEATKKSHHISLEFIELEAKIKYAAIEGLNVSLLSETHMQKESLDSAQIEIDRLNDLLENAKHQKDGVDSFILDLNSQICQLNIGNVPLTEDISKITEDCSMKLDAERLINDKCVKGYEQEWNVQDQRYQELITQYEFLVKSARNGSESATEGKRVIKSLEEMIVSLQYEFSIAKDSLTQLAGKNTILKDNERMDLALIEFTLSALQSSTLSHDDMQIDLEKSTKVCIARAKQLAEKNLEIEELSCRFETFQDASGLEYDALKQVIEDKGTLNEQLAMELAFSHTKIIEVEANICKVNQSCLKLVAEGLKQEKAVQSHQETILKLEEMLSVLKSESDSLVSPSVHNELLVEMEMYRSRIDEFEGQYAALNDQFESQIHQKVSDNESHQILVSELRSIKCEYLEATKRYRESILEIENNCQAENSKNEIKVNDLLADLNTVNCKLSDLGSVKTTVDAAFLVINS